MVETRPPGYLIRVDDGEFDVREFSVLAARGRWHDWAVTEQIALDLHRETGSRWGVAETLGHLGDTRHAAENPEEARAAWEEALAILADLHHPDADPIRAKLRELDVGLRH